jgi:hypothetical protein
MKFRHIAPRWNKGHISYFPFIYFPSGAIWRFFGWRRWVTTNECFFPEVQ